MERVKEEKMRIFADHERRAKQQAVELERAKEENKELSSQLENLRGTALWVLVSLNVDFIRQPTLQTDDISIVLIGECVQDATHLHITK